MWWAMDGASMNPGCSTGPNGRGVSLAHSECFPVQPPSAPAPRHPPVCHWGLLVVHGCHRMAHAAEDVNDGVGLQHVLVAAHQVKQRARLGQAGKGNRRECAEEELSCAVAGGDALTAACTPPSPQEAVPLPALLLTQ